MMKIRNKIIIIGKHPIAETLIQQFEGEEYIVIFGMGEIAETVAIQSARVAYNPIYVRSHSLWIRSASELLFENPFFEQGGSRYGY